MNETVTVPFESTPPFLTGLTAEMVSNCSYCTMISPDPAYRTPVSCTKLSGSCCPILVNLATCLTCGEYKNTCGTGVTFDV
ncbi:MULTISPECIES: hypothetical protein [Paenibacillus]|uniref:hypothetical protein n=1 Tax=Paenibacillus TaxID=44249 RepID=UPI0022B8A81B|nr:hypothetical protein [Paenibacillus caseinilyticus]MCZ8519188.1 hypothetical protein [Paenibacillus caseinilyticus]